MKIFLIRSRCCAVGGVVFSSISIVTIARDLLLSSIYRVYARFYALLFVSLCVLLRSIFCFGARFLRDTDAANEHRLEDVVQISYFCDEFSSRMRGNVEIVRVRFFFSRSTR